MNYVETLEANKKIAIFMGYTEKQLLSGVHVLEHTSKADFIYTGQLGYNFRWDWLMPVVEKILSQKWQDGENVSFRTFGSYNSETGNIMVRFDRCKLVSGPDLITATYFAVIDYISTWTRI